MDPGDDAGGNQPGSHGSKKKPKPQQRQQYGAEPPKDKFHRWTTGALVAFTAACAAASIWQGCIVKTTARLAQRAWLYVPGCKLESEPSSTSSLRYAIDVSNGGETPATATITAYAWIARDMPRAPIPDSVPQETDFVPPKALPYGRIHYVQEAPFGAPAVSAYAAHQNRLFVKTRIRYVDAFSEPHTLRQCWFHEVDMDSRDFTQTQCPDWEPFD